MSFAQAYRDATGAAPAELVASLRESLAAIRARSPHHEAAVDSIGERLGEAGERPTLLEVLVAAYMLNGGVVLKHRLEPEDLTLAAEMDSLLDEISRFGCGTPEPPDSDPGVTGTT